MTSAAGQHDRYFAAPADPRPSPTDPPHPPPRTAPTPHPCSTRSSPTSAPDPPRPDQAIHTLTPPEAAHPRRHSDQQAAREPNPTERSTTWKKHQQSATRGIGSDRSKL